MALTGKTKLRIALGVFAVLFALAAYEAVAVWWNYGYSKGSRSGVVRKISVKGPPYCKYMSAELVLQGSSPAQAPEVWEFSVDDYDDKAPLMIALKDAEKAGARITVDYRQDRGSLFRCTPSEFFVTRVEK